MVPLNQHVPKHVTDEEAQKIVDSGFPTSCELPDGTRVIDKDMLYNKNVPGVGALSGKNDPREVGDAVSPITNLKVRNAYNATRASGFPTAGIDFQRDGDVNPDWHACPKCGEFNDPDARFCDNCGTQFVAN